MRGLGRKLCDPSKGTKIYWETISKILNRKKVTCIPPVIENDIIYTSCVEKAGIFNDYFVKQCSLLVNETRLPDSLPYRTISSLENIEISEEKIVKITNKLNPNKAHGCENISIHMLKLCARECSKPFKILFKKCLQSGHYPAIWEKANVVPVHKKGNRQLTTNYRPISLLPICGKIFENIIFDEVYNHLSDNDLLSSNQSGFRPGDSTINQLLSITHEIYQAFENYHETRAVVLDISKAFDKVWHEGLLLKVKSNGIAGPLYLLIKDFLAGRLQRVVLNGKTSSWQHVSAGVPQGSVLGPLFFLLYINDLSENVSSQVKLFADDTSIFQMVSDVSLSWQILSNDLYVIQNWAYRWKMSFNPDPSKQAQEVIFSSKRIKDHHLPLSFNDYNQINIVNSHKHLGLILDEKLTFSEHVRAAIVKAKR